LEKTVNERFLKILFLVLAWDSLGQWLTLMVMGKSPSRLVQW